eukprot:TRINITY_DN41706_c0_g1_i1.p1 TRINITY_DN41706_c0_g1~~TRINITY_DN41706_c0_g1_i1.p1  ORF type:complete len:487 (-),score=108.74 TRINITY_DN41706_c0_g1_i1:192-1484(-)
MAMMSGPATDEKVSRRIRRTLIAVEPGTSTVQGMVSPSHLTQSKAMAESHVIKGDQSEEPAKKMRRHKFKRHRRSHKEPQPVKLAEVVSQRDTATCSLMSTLGDAADALVASGRTAAVVADDNYKVRGVLTENDILAALLEGASKDCKLDAWLRGGHSRLPGFLVPASTLPSTSSLAEAAAVMATCFEEVIVGSGFACHHLLVRDPEADGNAEGPHRLRILSALDIARGMIDAVAAQAAGAPGSIESDAAVLASDMTVEMAMKQRALGVASCKQSDTLWQAFQTMFESRQNCVIVVSGARPMQVRMDQNLEEAAMDPALLTGEEEEWQREHGKILGVITAADALRAFSESVRTQGVTVEGWLRGLLPDEEHKTPGQRSIPADASLSDAALAMAEANIHHLLVMSNSNQEIIGVISALDITRALAECYRDL